TTTAAATATGADAAWHGADALAELALLLASRRLRLGDAEQHHLLALAHAGEHLGVVEVAEPQAHETWLDAGRRLDEHHLRAVRACARPRPAASQPAAAAAETATRAGDAILATAA